MPLQDLTPQLRTRLNRMERSVGWFVCLSTILLLVGFGYYIYHTAENKGWFKIKAPFHIFVNSSAGLNVGDKVYLMGFAVGAITSVQPLPPGASNNVRVDFEVVDPYFHYLWTDGSVAKLNGADFLGKRQLELTRATSGYALVMTQPVTAFTNLDELKELAVSHPGEWQLAQEVFDANSNRVFRAYDPLTESNLETIAALKPDAIYAFNNTVNKQRVVASWLPRYHRYKIFLPKDDSAWIKTVETPPVGDQIQAMIAQVQTALPNILALTNKVDQVLDNAVLATSNLNLTIAATHPLVANLTGITGDLRGPGALGTWVLGSNAPGQISGTLTNVNTLLVNVDTNLNQLTDQVGMTLINLANITSNLNTQVQANSNLLWGISKSIMDTDDFIQGLKRHWLLRSAFKKSPAPKPQPPTKTN